MAGFTSMFTQTRINSNVSAENTQSVCLDWTSVIWLTSEIFLL